MEILNLGLIARVFYYKICTDAVNLNPCGTFSSLKKKKDGFALYLSESNCSLFPSHSSKNSGLNSVTVSAV